MAILASAMCLLFTAVPVSATQLAEWNFDDGTANDLLGNYDLGAVGGGPAISGGIATFDGIEASPSYLETSGFGGNPTWTLALRIRAAAPLDQGTYQGIFSNNNSSSANYSWQVESFGGAYQFRTQSGTYGFGLPTGGWDTIVIRKLSSSDGDIWLNGVQVVSSMGSNPGGLQNFRMGTNRNSSAFFGFEMDFARVFDTVENPTLVPEPSIALLFGLGLAGLASSRGSAQKRAPADLRIS